MILPETDRDEAVLVAGRILEAFRQSPFAAEGRMAFPIGASIGIATHPADGRSATELIAIADLGLYDAKDAGGNQVRARDARCRPTPRQRRVEHGEARPRRTGRGHRGPAGDESLAGAGVGSGER